MYHSVGHFCILGFSDCQHFVSDGGPLRFPAHPPFALGRIPVEVLQRRGILVRAILVQGHSQTSELGLMNH